MALLAGERPSKVGNFALIDHEGKFHELDYELKEPGVKGLFIFIHGNGCKLVEKRTKKLIDLRKKYELQGIRFWMLNANRQDNRAEICEAALEFDTSILATAEIPGRPAIPILIDDSQIVAQSLGVERTAEAYLISAKGKKIVYHGAIDDRLSVQADKPVAKNHYLEDAIRNLLAGKEIDPVATDAPGCKITYPKFTEPLTYTRDIAPILAKNCLPCHTKGGLGPFSMSSYRKVAGWSDMMAEVIMTRQMPPWHADPEIGEFSNDCSLSTEEAHKIVSWISAGSVKGEGPDPLLDFKPVIPKWHLGDPDHVIKLPKQEVAAKGVFKYRYVTKENPFDCDVWLTATEIRPGNTSVLHHVIVTSHPADRAKDRSNEQWITGYAPGTQGQLYPEGSSVYLKKGHKLRFQLHYTASGKKVDDYTQLGLHITKERTAKTFRTAIVAQRGLKILPGDANSEIPHSGYEYKDNIKNDKGDDDKFHPSHFFKKGATLYAINPHMHFRGKSMKFEAKIPDGSDQIFPLLSVPNYDFNWQRTYLLKNPLKLPAGSRVYVRNAWDNSDLNPHNPDPTKTVKWGDQTTEEMFFATIGYIED